MSGGEERPELAERLHRQLAEWEALKPYETARVSVRPDDLRAAADIVERHQALLDAIPSQVALLGMADNLRWQWPGYARVLTALAEAVGVARDQ